MAHPKITGLQGVNVAAITPRGKGGEINFGAAFELIDYLCAARVGGIALFTAWGEYPALAVDDRARLLYLAVKRSRVPVLAGVGSATLDQSVELAREARSAGASAILIPPPLFYRCDEDDTREFFIQFATQLGSGLDIYLTGEIPLQTARTLLESGCFAGMETSGGDTDTFDLCTQIAGCAPLSGHDASFVGARSAGVGVISAPACAAPELTMAIDRAIAARDTGKIDRLERARQELIGWLERFPQPIGVKAAVAARGIRTGPPSVPLSPEKQKCLGQFREWFQDWLPSTQKLAAHV